MPPILSRNKGAEFMTAGQDNTALPIIEVKDIKKHFGGKKSLFGKTGVTIKAVDGVDFSIARGETFGIVGESGCGKTTLGRCIVRALEPSAGQVLYNPEEG